MMLGGETARNVYSHVYGHVYKVLEEDQSDCSEPSAEAEEPPQLHFSNLVDGATPCSSSTIVQQGQPALALAALHLTLPLPST